MREIFGGVFKSPMVSPFGLIFGTKLVGGIVTPVLDFTWNLVGHATTLLTSPNITPPTSATVTGTTVNIVG